MRFPWAVLFLAGSLHAAVVVGPEREVTAPAFGAAFGLNRLSSLATDGTDFLTLWDDETAGREGLYATVVNEAGATRPLAPQPLVRGAGPWWGHAVWTGDAYLVLVQTVGATTAVRLDRDGQVLEAPVAVDLEDRIGSLAWNGRHALAVTYDDLGVQRTVLLDARGRVMRTSTLPRGHLSTVLAAGDAFVVIRTTYEGNLNGPAPVVTTLWAIRVSPNGTPGGPVELAKVNAHPFFSAAANGDRIGVAMVASSSLKSELLRFTVDAETLATQSHPAVPLPPLLSFDVVAIEDEIRATWTYVEDGGQTTKLASIAFNASTTRHAITIPNTVGGLALESNGRTVFGVCCGAPVRGIGFNATLTRSTTPVTTIATAAVRQSRPAIATNGETSLLAWLDDTSFSTGNVMVRRFDRAGNPLDAQPRLVASNVGNDVSPAVTFIGNGWLVAWQAGRSLPEKRVFVRRLAADGTPDDQPIDAGPGLYPALGSNGKVAVLVMTNITRNGMVAARFNASGQRIDATPFPIDDDRGYSPALATNGREILAVWEASPIRTQRPVGIVGVRFAEDGTLLDPRPIEIALAPKSIEPHVASNGTDFLVTYTHYLPNGLDDPNPHTIVYRTHAKRVLRAGVLADSTAQQTGPLLGEGRASQAARLGAGYVVTMAREEAKDKAPNTLHAVRVDASGSAVETVDVPNGQSYSPLHALTSHGNALLLAYPRIEPALASVQRLFLRTIAAAEDAAPGRRRAARK